MKGSVRLEDSWRFCGFVIWYISCIHLQQTLLELVALWQQVTWIKKQVQTFKRKAWKQDQESDFVLSKVYPRKSGNVLFEMCSPTQTIQTTFDHRLTLENPKNLPKICQTWSTGAVLKTTCAVICVVPNILGSIIPELILNQEAEV